MNEIDSKPVAGYLRPDLAKSDFLFNDPILRSWVVRIVCDGKAVAVLRVNLDLLEFSDDYMYLLNGLPFSGIAVEYVDGRTVCETTYKEGELWGPAVSWHENGRVQAESSYGIGDEITIVKEWFPNGSLKSEVVTRLGRALLERNWNEEGALVKEIISAEYDAEEVESQVRNRENSP